MAGKQELYLWKVACEGHSPALVFAPDWELATVEAAKFWDVPWREVAAKCCEVSRQKALRGTCSKCGRYIYDGAGFCAACADAMRAEEQRTREFIRRRYRRDAAEFAKRSK